MFRYFKDLDKLANALHVKHFATMDSELEYIDSQDLAIEVRRCIMKYEFKQER